MAKKYGGPHSPQGQPNNAKPPFVTPDKRVPNALRPKRLVLLYAAPLPLIGKALSAESVLMIQYLGALALLLLAAWLTTEGVKAEIAYNERRVARPPSIPRKIFGSIATGLGLGLVGLAGYGPLDALIFTIIGAVLHFLVFGPDPLRKKGMEGMSDFDTERVAKAIEKAERYVIDMQTAAKGFNDRVLKARVEDLAEAARDMFRTIEDDPRDLTQSRKFLSVYLKGARDATLKFAEVYKRNRNTDARADYETLLSDLEASFQGKREILLLEDRTDLDVEIEVLRDRLKQEGVAAEI